MATAVGPAVVEEDFAAEDAALNKLEEEKRKCRGCKRYLPLSSFAKSTRANSNGGHVSYCNPCLANHRLRMNERNKTPEAKATKAAYSKSAIGKATNKRAKRSEKGKANVQRHTTRRTERRNADPHFNMIARLYAAAGSLSSGRIETSPTFVKRTSFQSSNKFLEHMASTFAEDEEGTKMKWANYGDKWEVEHRIPVEAYDHTNPVDIKRCWSAANMRALSPKANREKGIQILLDEADVVGVDFWPLKWNGQFPSKEFIDDFYAKMLARKDIPVEDDDEA